MKTINYIILLGLLCTLVFLNLYGYVKPTNLNTITKKTTICVLPLDGGVKKHELDSALSYLKSTFPTTNIIIGKNTTLPKSCFNGKRYRADSILIFLNSLDINADKIIGLISKDISITRNLVKNGKKVTYSDFGIFGLARCPGDVCVISSYRLKKNVNMFAKTVVHEFMHTLGVKHCEHSYCIMQDGKGSGKNMKESSHIHKDCLSTANNGLNY